MFYKRACNHLVDHVCPTRRNNLLPRILHTKSIWAILGVSVALIGFSQVLRLTDYLNIKAEIYPTVIVNLTNKEREGLGLSPLQQNALLEQAANLKLKDMINHGYFAHTSPSGATPWYWFSEAGYKFLYAGENLAINFEDSESVQNAWLNSPTHKANIVNPSFTEIGVATTTGIYQNNPTTFVVELFGTPATLKSTNEIAPTEKESQNDPAPQIPVEPNEVDITGPVAIVAGESIDFSNRIVSEDMLTTGEKEDFLQIVEENKDLNQSFVSVANTNPNLEKVEANKNNQTSIPFFVKPILSLDKYIGIFIELIIVALILATATIIVREQQRKHRLHAAYGILTTVILTSFLFVGRMGVFTQAQTVPIYLVIQKSL